MSLPTRQVKVIRSYVTALQFSDQIQTMLWWASRRQSRAVYVANVHMLMEAYWNPTFARILENADLVTPDGMPLVWMIRQMGIPQDRVAGMDILLGLCQIAPKYDVSVFFLGSKPEILDNIKKRLVREFPLLKVAGLKSLPFRPLTPEEDDEVIR
jgi:N-acetylglucosaminyldiphosphoundecaprenol N-acetyl-beta-D-mannosaminyltransferase